LYDRLAFKCHPYMGTSLIITRPENGVQNAYLGLRPINALQFY